MVGNSYSLFKKPLKYQYKRMEQELSSIVQENFLNLDQAEPSFLPINTPVMRALSQPQDIPACQVKAINPFEIYKDYPASVREPLINSFFKKKLFAGIQMLFGIQSRVDQSQQFLGVIDSDIFNSLEPDHNLISLFGDDEKPSENCGQTEKGEEFSKKLEELTEKLSSIQKQTFKSIGINKTIGKSFAERFDNFLSLKEESSFSNYLINSFEHFLNQTKNKTFPGLDLITMTFEFWMNMFRQFIRQVWKYNEKFSLNLFKKQKSNVGGHIGVEISSCGRSTVSSSNAANQKDRRRPWGKQQIDLLEKIIESNAVFSQARLQGLSQQLGRTPSSISSKVVKLTKARQARGKDRQNPEPIKIINDLEQISDKNIFLPLNNKKIDGFNLPALSSQTSLQQKIKQILLQKSHPLQGLTKEEIVQKMSEKFELGIQDQSWKNSVGSILSSNKDIEKLKPSFRLVNPHAYEYNYTFSSSFKDRIIRCLLALPGYRGDIAEICTKYGQIYYHQLENSGSADHKKVLSEIKTNISKTLQRYSDDGGTFEKDRPKILYKYRRVQYSKGIQQSQEKDEIINDEIFFG